MRITLLILSSILQQLSCIDIKGVSPERQLLYKSDELYCPGNKSKRLTPEMINDDFCDCPEDGFDEPGR